MRGMHLVKNNRDCKLDTLYACHDQIDASLDKLHTAFEKVNMSDLDYNKLQLLFDKLYLELYQLEKELQFF